MTKEDFEKIESSLSKLNEISNSDLMKMLETLASLFEKLKTDIINLTFILDDVEKKYNTILSEYETRVK